MDGCKKGVGISIGQEYWAIGGMKLPSALSYSSIGYLEELILPGGQSQESANDASDA